MASVNKILLIGNLGYLSRASLDDAGQQAFDRYDDALHDIGSALRNLWADTFAKAARELSAALNQLRKLAERHAIPKKMAAPDTPLVTRTAAFFHAAKVDARNLP